MDTVFRIQRAIDFIESNLKEELSTDLIAESACFSMWHFQRVFSAVVGDSVKDYVRQRRMASALLELGSTRRKILDIAIENHFESQEAFTRAFKAQFGRTPGQCRKEGIQASLFRAKPRISLEYLNHLYGGITMHPRFETVPEMQIVGLEKEFISILSPDRDDHQVIPQLWQNFRSRMHEISDRKNNTNIGLVINARKGHADKYYYLAGTEVHGHNSAPEGMSTMAIPAGRYAVFVHKGSIQKLEHTMRYIFGSWLPRSKETLRDAPDFSVQGPKFDALSEESELEIYVPIC